MRLASSWNEPAQKDELFECARWCCGRTYRDLYLRQGWVVVPWDKDMLAVTPSLTHTHAPTAPAPNHHYT